MISNCARRAGLAAVVVLGGATMARASDVPLFAFAQASDAQVRTPAHQALFDFAMRVIGRGGEPGGLLPMPIEFVIFPGDCTWDATPAEYQSFLATMDRELTSRDIPWMCTPGNHDTVGGLAAYRNAIADDAPWTFDTECFVGQNGVAGGTGWRGITFVGFNNCYELAYDTAYTGPHAISAADLTEVNAAVGAAVARGDSVFMVAHRPYNDQNLTPLGPILNLPQLRGFCHGHLNEPEASQGLFYAPNGVFNPDAWELNSNGLTKPNSNGFLYYEVYRNRINVWEVELADQQGPLGVPDETILLAAPLQRTSVAYCTAGTTQNGCQAQLATCGEPSATASSGFMVNAAGVEGQRDGIYIYGSRGRQARTWGNSSSFSCVAPPLRRGSHMAGAGTPGACDGTLSLDLNARWTAKPNHNPGSGAVVQLQLWYRDPFSTSNQTSAFSNAIEFTVGP